MFCDHVIHVVMSCITMQHEFIQKLHHNRLKFCFKNHLSLSGGRTPPRPQTQWFCAATPSHWSNSDENSTASLFADLPSVCQVSTRSMQFTRRCTRKRQKDHLHYNIGLQLIRYTVTSHTMADIHITILHQVEIMFILLPLSFYCAS